MHTVTLSKKHGKEEKMNIGSLSEVVYKMHELVPQYHLINHLIK